ncbi:ATP-dependent nuclease [Streptomyces sp. NPDC002324]
MGVSYGLARFTLVDGAVVEPPLNGMTVLTGPNNSGKSVLLRELFYLMRSFPGTLQPRRWVESIKVHKTGSGDEFISWLREQGHQFRYQPQAQRTVLRGPTEDSIESTTAASEWERSSFPRISQLLINGQWTEHRLGDQTSSLVWDQSEPPNHPTQYMWESKEAHSRFSNLFEQAFGLPVAINRYIPRIELQIGSTGMPDTPPPAPPELREAYSVLPYLRDQGDGMKAFGNILLHSLVTPAPVIVIDEPEAFLHPPQARLLGRYLALHTPSPCQVIVATHSADFLNGVIEGNSVRESGPPRPLTMVRISRIGDTVDARTLAADSVSDILGSPLLRYSNIISGLFHDGVILCEAEGDCHFYAATLDVVRGRGRHENLAFLHVNGKARLSDAAHKLRTCGIPTAIIADFDVLNDATKIKQMLSHLGGRWEDVQSDLQILQAHARSSVIATPANELRKAISKIIGNPSGKATLSQYQVDEITSALKTANGWKTLKASGLTDSPVRRTMLRVACSTILPDSEFSLRLSESLSVGCGPSLR